MAKRVLHAFASVACIWTVNATHAEARSPPSGQEEGARLARHNLLASQVLVSDPDIVIIGDSIAAAFPGPMPAPHKVLNLGISSDTTYNVKWRLRRYNLKRLKPKAVLIILGTNNFWLENGQATAFNIRDVIHLVQRIWPPSQIIVSAILPRGVDYTEFANQRNEANQQLAKNAGENRFTFIDPSVEISCKFNQSDCPNFNKDLIHPNTAGYVIMSRYFRKALVH